MNNPLLSIIVICGPNISYLRRILNNLILQDNLLYTEIIVVNDSSENFSDIINYYKTLYENIRLITTNDDTHFPGDTRQAGIDAAEGEWLISIDYDDILFDNSISLIKNEIKNYINSCDDKAKLTLINTPIALYDEQGINETGRYDSAFNAMLHGKIIYKKFLTDNNLRMPRRTAHEDTILTNWIKVTLLKTGLDYYNSTICFYKWIQTSDSLTRKHEYTNPATYNIPGHPSWFEKYISDFFKGMTEPWIYLYIVTGEFKEICVNKCIQFLSIAYNQYNIVELFSTNDEYRLRPYMLNDIKCIFNRIREILQITDEDIQNYIISNESDILFENEYHHNDAGINGFIEFIKRLK